ncbi:phosphate transport atp-binding protein pstb [hydrocarbon metagenome]|uniref:Phosphate transport atp-binding protein pstb n=1 Tax=hydrocarbon metagenome TaxID=938273 RepID=A0A0W8G8T2_9ZZZZ
MNAKATRVPDNGLPPGTVMAARGLCVSFAGRQILSGVDLDVAGNALTVIVGRSGSGKTTLLRALNRLNECHDGCRTTGRVLLSLGGRAVDVHDRDFPVTELRRRVGMVFQTPNLLPLSVAANLTMPLRHVLGMGKAEALEAAREALVAARLWDEVKDRLEAPAKTLSGGQAQRLCLARAMALEPDVLLVDEPAASLDFMAARAIEDLLSGLRERYALVVVSHGLGSAARMADHLVVMRRGQVSARFAAAELARGEALVQCMEEVF